jgi:hypothetical protein
MRHIWEAFLNGDLTAVGSAIAGGLAGGAWDSLQEKINEWTGYDSVQEWFNDLVDDLVPDVSTYEEARERLDELWENFTEFGEQVVQDIGDAVSDILDTGAIDAQTDGGLGETQDIFTPESDAPDLTPGDLPGISVPETGMNRDAGGGGGSGYNSGGGGDSPTPLGETGGSEAPPSDSAPPPPSAEDLGLPPGSFVEYQPGQVVITYPDGTTETRPWP